MGYFLRRSFPGEAASHTQICLNFAVRRVSVHRHNCCSSLRGEDRWRKRRFDSWGVSPIQWWARNQTGEVRGSWWSRQCARGAVRCPGISAWTQVVPAGRGAIVTLARRSKFCHCLAIVSFLIVLSSKRNFTPVSKFNNFIKPPEIIVSYRLANTAEWIVHRFHYSLMLTSIQLLFCSLLSRQPIEPKNRIQFSPIFSKTIHGNLEIKRAYQQNQPNRQ